MGGKEGGGAVPAFAVTLSRAATGAFTVDYAPSDGREPAGADHAAAGGAALVRGGRRVEDDRGRGAR